MLMVHKVIKTMNERINFFILRMYLSIQFQIINELNTLINNYLLKTECNKIAMNLQFAEFECLSIHK